MDFNNQNNNQDNQPKQQPESFKQDSNPDSTGQTNLKNQRRFQFKPRLLIAIGIVLTVVCLAILLIVVQTNNQSPTNRGLGEDNLIDADEQPPVLRISQNGQTMTVESEFELVKVEYFTTLVEPECDPTSEPPSWKATSAEAAVTDLPDNTWVCFRAEAKNKFSGYAKQKVDLSSSDLDIIQDGLSVLANAEADLTDWQYFTSSTNPNCDQTNTEEWNLAKSGKKVDKVSTDDQWVCFRAKNKLGVYSYGEIQVVLTAPTINLFQENKKVLGASTFQVTGWQYFKSTSRPTCNAEADWSTAKNGSIASNLSGNSWVCFRAKNKVGIWGFAKFQYIKVEKLTAKQVNRTVVAETNAAVDKFEYVLVDDNIACNSRFINWQVNAFQSSVTTDLDNNDRVCFRALLSQSNSYIYSTVVVVKVNPPELWVSSASVSLTNEGYVGTIVGRSNENLTGWQYFVLSEDNRSVWETLADISGTSRCKQFNFFAWNQEQLVGSGQQVEVDDDVHFVCFRAKNSKGVYGYDHYLHPGFEGATLH